MKQIPLPLTPRPEPRFDGFLLPEGSAGNESELASGNAAAWQHLRQLSLPSPPVYLWGPSGSGKTHLLRAVAGRMADLGHRVVSLLDNDSRDETSAAALALIDDCDALDAAAQHAAFTLFIEAAASGLTILAAGRLPPVDLPLRDDLRTRLAWGTVFALQPLDDDLARLALHNAARERGFELPREVIDHLLLRFPRDLKSQMQLLDRIDEFGLQELRRVTVPMIRRMLADAVPAEAAAS